MHDHVILSQRVDCHRLNLILPPDDESTLDNTVFN